ncbi:alpha-carbonic anhydrase domain-containing protein [Trichonephila clavipes]|nr:alpha-carbonic anhydrase domain-containing protein [Trichonephila clavipes]
MVKVSDHGRHVMSSSPVPLKTRRVGQRCTLNLSRAETFSRWCGGCDVNIHSLTLARSDVRWIPSTTPVDTSSSINLTMHDHRRQHLDLSYDQLLTISTHTKRLHLNREGAAITCKIDDEEQWSYNGRTNGPSAWGERYPTCFGKQQSPVAINTRDVMIDLFAQKLQMKNYDIPVAKSTIINNGHSDFDVGGSTFHSVRTRRCTRVTDLNSVNQSRHCTFCCGVQIFTNEVSVTSLTSAIEEQCAHGWSIGVDPTSLGGIPIPG